MDQHKKAGGDRQELRRMPVAQRVSLAPEHTHRFSNSGLRRRAEPFWFGLYPPIKQNLASSAPALSGASPKEAIGSCPSRLVSAQVF
jgi:hypothetical protein